MYRMYGIPQGAKDGGAVMYRSLTDIHVFRDTSTSCTSDVRADICSCNICTSAVPGGRIPQGAMEGKERRMYSHSQISMSSATLVHPVRRMHD